MRTLTAGLIDYAGLFPPAGLAMDEAVASYASYRLGPDSGTLGRFVVPLSRLDDFELSAVAHLPRGAETEPWRLTVIADLPLVGRAEVLARFNCHHWSESEAGHALIDSVEVRVSSIREVDEIRAALAPFFTLYFEITPGASAGGIIEEVGRLGGHAKIRTGGVTANSFPTSPEIISFMSACNRHGVPFKATAGLHHPLRGLHRLTYETDSESASMFGFLNVFLAAALIYQGASERDAARLLEEEDSSAISFADESVEWRGITISGQTLREAREKFAISFGSCSFAEPISELNELLAAHAR